MSNIYSRRLSGPQMIHEMAGTVEHFEVPAGHVYVVRELVIVNMSNTLTSDGRVVVAPVGGTPNHLYIGALPPLTTVMLDTRLTFSAGEKLLAYMPVGGELVLSTHGFDFAD